MKVLFLSHRIPFPPNKGDKIRSYNVLRHLCERHEVHLATLIDAAADVPALEDLRPLVSTLLHARIDQPGRKLFALRAMPQLGSITVLHFYSRSLQRAIDELVAKTNFDAVVCSSSPMAEYVFRSAHFATRLAGATKIMDLMDVDSYKWRQYASRSSWAPSLVYRYEARRLEEYERTIYREFDRLLLVSEQEKAYFPAPDAAQKLVAISNGVDLAYFRRESAPVDALPAFDESRPSVVFTGMMDYWPNVEGMQWFIDAVLPLVRAAVPGVRLYVVGGRPGRNVQNWAQDPDVVVTGFVPDVRAYVARADVCIAPLRVARGIQNKVLEAMAMSKAVVSTPEAHEGIEADPHAEICVAQGEADFAAAVVALLRDGSRARQIGARARACVERRYSWTANLSRLDELLSASRVAAERAPVVGGRAFAQL